MIKKVISGGQIGADIAGLRAAVSYAVPTGGWMPKGWRTKEGSMPGLEKLFGLRENDSPNYAARTFRNVEESDGTIRFAYNFESQGERCTMRAIKTYTKPWFDVYIVMSYGALTDNVWIRDQAAAIEAVVRWIRGHKIKVLNVAGNADRMIEPVVEKFLEEVIQLDALLPT